MSALLARSPTRIGAAAIRAALVRWSGVDAPARSELELRFIALCDRARLPRPRVNTRVAGFEVDFAWPSARLIVEVDGFAFHGGASAFERDRARDAALALAGWRVVRFSWRQVVDQPRVVAAVVRRELRGGKTAA